MKTPSIFSAIVKMRSLLSKKEKLKWIIIVSFAFCTSALEMLTAVVIVGFAQVLNRPESGQIYMTKLGFADNLPHYHIVLFMVSICGVVYLIKNIVAAVEVFYQNFTIQKMNYHFKNKILHRYAKVDYGFYLTRNASFGLTVVGTDIEKMFSGGMISLASVLSESIIFFFLIAMLVYMKPSLAFIIFGIIVIFCFFIIKILLPQFYRFGQKLQESALHCGQTLLQFFYGFKEIVLLGKRDAFISAYQFHARKSSHIQAMQKAIDSLPRIIIEVLFVAVFVLTISIQCLRHEAPIEMIGILGGYLYVGFRLMPGLNRLINLLNSFKVAIPSIERVYEEYHTVGVKENYIDIPNFSYEKSINFKKVNFSYQNTEKNALSLVNLEIKKGECIGIVGETGSGKSTFIDLLLGLLRPNSGEILIDNRYPVNSYQWHAKIGYVPQSLYLVDDTIEANIAFGEDAAEVNQEQLNKVIQDAQLTKFIKQLPNGVKTLVGDRGVLLSGGERQRIAIARALYRDPEVLIFDEATSALDNETEETLMKTIRVVSKNRTVIMIAHRLSTLKDCNRVIEVNSGQIVKINSIL